MQGLDALEKAVQEAIKPTKIELHNEIHPFWHPDRWPVDFDYSKVFLSARLASKYIESAAGVWYCHTMFFGEMTKIDRSRATSKQCRSRQRMRGQFAKPQDVNEEAIRAVKEKLVEMSKDVRHRVGDMKHLGLTSISPRVGDRTMITYDRKQIEPLFADKTDSDQRAAQNIYLAALMMHEFARK